MSNEPWNIHFFQDRRGEVPALQFFDAVPIQVVAGFKAILDAVAEAPPPTFSGGGKWEAMHGDMSGLFEARVGHASMNHRLFCVLDRNANDLGGPSIVVLDGLSKPKRTAAAIRDYSRILNMKGEFLETRSVLR